MIPYIDHRRLKFRSLPFSGFFAEKDEYFLRLLIIKKRLPVKEAGSGFCNEKVLVLEQFGDCFAIVGDFEGATFRGEDFFVQRQVQS